MRARVRDNHASLISGNKAHQYAGCFANFFQGAGDDAIRRDRVFYSYGVRDPELLGVAAPVFGPDDELVGGLILSAPPAAAIVAGPSP